MKIQKKRPLTEKQLAECAALKEIFNAKKEVLGLTQEKAAQHLGMNQGSFSHYLNGRNAINLEFALSISQLLGVPVTDFAPRYRMALSDFHERETGTLDSFTRFRLDREGAGYFDERAGQVRAEASAYPLTTWNSQRMHNPASDKFEGESDPNLIASTEQAGANGYWIEMQGTSMSSATAPSFPPGTYLLINPDDYVIQSGKFYLARHSEGDYAIRQYMREAGTDYLVALNSTFPAIPMNPEWTLVGLVVEARMPGL